ncbi:unnamed protein product [Rhodiola kirilowii]
MSRERSHHDYQEDDEVNLFDQNNEAPPQFPILDDPEQLFRNQRARDRNAILRNQGPPEGQNEAGPVQPPLLPLRPQPRQVPRQEPVFDDYYGNNNYREPTMGELNAPDFETQPWCIHEGPELEYITINAPVAHSLPKFSGAHGESATTHLQRLHGICQNLKPNRVNIDNFKLKAFYFSLIDSANDWFLSLPSGSIRTWVQMQKKFLDKYYPAGRAMQVRRQLQDIRQGPNETMYDYLEKFNHLERSCCTLGLPEKLIIEYLINGLTPLDKKFLNASAGGSVMRLSLSGIRRLISDVAENAWFTEETTRQDEFSRTKNVARAEMSENSMTEEMKQMKEMMMQILRRQPVPVKPCEFCGSTDHKTDACPTLIVEEPEEVNAVVGYQGYNNNNSNDRSRPNQYQASSSNQQGPNKWLEDMMKELSSTVQQSSGTMQQLSGTVQQLSTTMHQNQVKNDGAIADLKKHMSQLATAMSGKKLVIKPMEQDEDKSPRLPGEEQIRPEALETLEQNTADENEDASEEERDMTDEEGNTSKDHRPDLVSASEKHEERPVPRTETPKISTSLPFLVLARVPKQHVMDEDVFELFSKVEINIPLLEAIKQIPRYAKFLKEICTNRRRSTRYDQELMSRNVSAVIQR